MLVSYLAVECFLLTQETISVWVGLYGKYSLKGVTVAINQLLAHRNMLDFGFGFFFSEEPYEIVNN